YLGTTTTTTTTTALDCDTCVVTTLVGVGGGGAATPVGTCAAACPLVDAVAVVGVVDGRICSITSTGNCAAPAGAQTVCSNGAGFTCCCVPPAG
ncbi:unnamed protein product, partial [Rotaria sordida]